MGEFLQKGELITSAADSLAWVPLHLHCQLHQCLYYSIYMIPASVSAAPKRGGHVVNRKQQMCKPHHFYLPRSLNPSTIYHASLICFSTFLRQSTFGVSFSWLYSSGCPLPSLLEVLSPALLSHISERWKESTFSRVYKQ